ncbi:MAG: AI-2E family transporter [Proteobacteria bacterium]|nr:AI-2E family transporter [Pseudomonadota bacterium]
MQSDDQIFIQRSIRWLIVGVATLGLILVLLWVLRGALTPLVVALTLAYLLDPVIDRFQAWHLPRGLAVLLLLGVALGALVSFALFVVPLMQQELAELARALPGYVDRLMQAIGPWLEENFDLELPGSFREGIDRLRSQGIAPPIETVRSVLGSATGFATGTIGSLIGLAVIPVIAFYLLVDFDRLTAGVLSLVPRPYLEAVREKARTVDRLLAGFIRGQLTVCLILGVLYAAGFWVIGIDLAVMIGIASGALAIIPYVGGALALSAASAMALFQFGLDAHLLAVVGWYAVVQGLEGFVLTPRIVGESLGLHPVTVILALLIGGNLLGFVGLLVAVPVTAVLQVFLQELVASYRDSGLYRGAS